MSRQPRKSKTKQFKQEKVSVGRTATGNAIKAYRKAMGTNLIASESRLEGIIGSAVEQVGQSLSPSQKIKFIGLKNEILENTKKTLIGLSRVQKVSNRKLIHVVALSVAMNELNRVGFSYIPKPPIKPKR